MVSKDRDKQIIAKILNYCEDVRLAHEHFDNDKSLFFDAEAGRVYRNAITMPILQIGELAKNLSEEFTNNHSSIPWKAVIRTRDFFAHHYWDIDYGNVWDTSHEDITLLEDYLSQMKL
ncbi:MAG: DUF86 domain-containing protein [Synergistaceae bacterium]|nr:DUF86 domain-containing protein [Synergistaceae bacterium]